MLRLGSVCGEIVCLGSSRGILSTVGCPAKRSQKICPSQFVFTRRDKIMRFSWGSVAGLWALLSVVKGMGANTCGLGSGILRTEPATGQLQDGTSIRIRTRVKTECDVVCDDGGVTSDCLNCVSTCFESRLDNLIGVCDCAEDDGTDIRPTFDSEGVVNGRIEVKPSGETAWGTIYGNSGWVST